MVAHGAGVALAAVALPRGRSSIAGGRGGRCRPAARAAAASSRSRVAPVERRRVPVFEQRQDAVEVVDLELAGHVRAAQAELPGGEQRVRRRPAASAR